jgi:parallel beta-helix repeat protein
LNEFLAQDTSSQYWRGDKSWQTLSKAVVGLANVDNTSDISKPVSTAQQASLDAKQPLDTDLSAIATLSPSNDDVIQRKSGTWTNRTPAQFKTDLTLMKSDVGLGNVPNVDATVRANHTGSQTASTISDFASAADARIGLQKAAANGLATLGSDSKIPSSQLPAIAITNTSVVSSQAAMLALTADVGDVAVRTDEGKTYILTSAPASVLANWQEILTPGDVISVNGQTGAVSLAASDVGAQAADSDLAALAGLSSTGLLVRTGAGTALTRSVTAGSGKLSVANGDGVSGNPTVDVIESAITLGNLGGTLPIASGGTAATDAVTARMNLGVDTTTNIAEGGHLYYTDTRVRANRLDQLAAPTTDLDLNTQRLVNVVDPVGNQDAATKIYVDGRVSAATPDATTSSKGLIQLAGDLAGTASSPTVPGLATNAAAISAETTRALAVEAVKANDSAVLHLIGNESANGVKTFTSAPVVPTAAFPESAIAGLVSDLAATEKSANKGVASGYASLDSGGKLPTSQLPASVLGALEYQGTYDASGGSFPTSPSKGYYWVISVQGVISGVTYKVGDWLTYDGTSWDKIDNSQVVSSVAGRTGAVVLAESDITGLTTDLAAKLTAASNLSDVVSPGTAFGNIKQGATTGATGVVQLAGDLGGVGTTSSAPSLKNVAKVFNILDYGAKGDFKTVSDGAITSGTNSLPSATASFSLADIGKQVTVKGAGAAGADLITTISGISGSNALLAANAGTTVTGAVIRWVTDDSAAINAACAAAASAGGGTVYVPTGNFFVYSKIQIGSYTTFCGGSWSSIITYGDGRTFDGCITNADHINGNVGIMVRDLQINGNRANTTPQGTGQNMLWFFACADYTWQNLYIHDTPHGAMVPESNNDTNLTEAPQDCRILNNLIDTTVDIGIYMAKTDGAIVKGNVIRNTASYAIRLVYAGGNTQNIVTNNRIYNCGIGNVVASIISEQSSAANIITNNFIVGSGADGIFLSNTTYHMVNNNFVWKSQKHGIHWVGPARGTINDNQILESSQLANNTYSGICLDGCSEAEVVGNHSGGATTTRQQYGITEVGVCANNNIRENFVQRNVTGGVNVLAATTTIGGNKDSTGVTLQSATSFIGAIDLGSNKITSLANGSLSTDAAAFGQIPTSAGSIGGLLAASNLSDVASSAPAFANIKQSATSSATGVVQLAGDLAGLATAVLVKSRAVTSTVGLVGSVADHIGNGTSDDVAIQAAVSGGGHVRVRAGLYTITASISVPSYTIISGEGTTDANQSTGGGTIFQRASGFDGPIFVNSNPSGNNYAIVLRDFSVSGAYASGTPTSLSRGIYFTNALRTLVSNVSINNTKGDGIKFDGSGVNWVTNCKLRGCQGSGIVFGSAGASDCAAWNNEIGSCLGNGISLNSVANCIVTGNFVYLCGQIGIDIFNSSGCLVSTNRVNDQGAAGVRITVTSGSAQFNTVSNNTLYNNTSTSSGAGILVSDTGSVGATYNLISLNKSYNSGTSRQKYGIQGTSLEDHNTITDNICFGNITAAVVTVGANDGVFNNNGNNDTLATTTSPGLVTLSPSLVAPNIGTATGASLNLGVGTLSAGSISIDGTAARSIAVSASAGTASGLTVQAGSSATGGTNTAGAALALIGGSGTGNSTAGYISFQPATDTTSGVTTQTTSEKMRLLTSTDGRLILGSADFSQSVDGITMAGNVARTIQVGRRTASNTGGRSLTVQAGGATINATDKPAGDLILYAGGSTGQGGANVRIQTNTRALSSGTSDNTPTDRIIATSPKSVTNNSATTLATLTLASGSVVAGQLHYAVEVTDGTDFQVEEGTVSYHATNKGGVIANNVVTKSSNQQAATAGTLAVTFTITNASSPLIQLNANSSLMPSTGYPRVTYTFTNLTQQAVAIS